MICMPWLRQRVRCGRYIDISLLPITVLYYTQTRAHKRFNRQKSNSNDGRLAPACLTVIYIYI